MTTTTTRWSSASGTPNPVASPADPFATIPGAYDDEPVPMKTVRDNAAYAWRNRSREVDEQVFTSLPADLVHDYRDALDAAAVAALDGPAGVLVEVWRERGYVMLACTQAAMGALDRDLPDELFHEVWDTAANRLDGHALAEAAGLGQQLLDYQDTNDSDRDY